MNKHEKIVSLMQTLGAGFRHFPDKTEERVNVLTDAEQDTLLELLTRVSSGGVRAYAFGHFPEGREPKKADTRVIWDKGPTPTGPKRAARLPEPDSYDAIDEHRAICRGCPSGCELRWDSKGNCAGYSCIVGQETAEMLAEYYRSE